MARADLARNRSRSLTKRRSSSGPSAPRTRVERRDAILRRRGFAALAASIVVAAVVLVAWFPAGALIAQNRTLAQASTTLTQLRAQDRALRAESKNLSDPAEVKH